MTTTTTSPPSSPPDTVAFPNAASQDLDYSLNRYLTSPISWTPLHRTDTASTEEADTRGTDELIKDLEDMEKK